MVFSLHRNLGLFLLTSFEIASEKAKPCPRSVLMDERTRTDGRTGGRGRGGGVTLHRQGDGTMDFGFGLAMAETLEGCDQLRP